MLAGCGCKFTAGEAALNGAADGYMMGSITGFISGGMTSNQCFAAGTLIATANGLIPIEDIQPGNFVWATNPETGETELKPAVQLFRNETDEWVHVTVNGEEIVCTSEHPFYSPVKGWTAACQLRAGDILVLVNGEYVVVEQVQHELLESPVATYNFEVQDFHTYYVGESAVLVHNLCTNSGGRHGGSAHRQKISEVKGSLEKKGWKVSAKESRIDVGGGRYRYPDIIATKGNQTRFYQIGRMTKSGKPVSREVRALRDLGKIAKTYFIPYR